MSLAEIREQLTNVRRARRISQRDMAKLADTWQSTVSGWERGDIMPSAASLIGWAESLGYEVALIPKAGLAAGGAVGDPSNASDLGAYGEER